MRKARFYAMFLLAIGALTACGNKQTTGDGASSGGVQAEGEIPQADPEKTYDISYTGYWCNADYEDGSYIEKMIEDALNVNITVEKAETADTVDLLLASGEMPDCMWTEKKTAAWMYENELARPIPRAMVEYYCPELIKLCDEYPLLYKISLNPENEDEFLYLPGVTFQYVDYYLPNDYYRYDWIENLGIDLGVNVEEVADRIYVADDGIELSKFTEIMDAFVNKDPDGNGKADTVGATAPMLNQGPFYSAYGFFTGINNENGRAEQEYALDAYKDYLKGFQQLYAKNLIDPEIISGDRQVSWDKVNTGMAGYWITSTNALNSWAVDRPPLTLLERDPNAKILMTPGIKPDGGTVQAVTKSSPAYGKFYVNANVDDEKLAKILEFFDYTIFGAGNADVHASMFYGEQGVDWKWNEDKTRPEKINMLNSGVKGTWTFGQFGQNKEVTTWTGEEPLFMAGAKYWAAGEDGIWMKWQTAPYKEDLAGETDYDLILQDITSDLDAYVANYRTQAIMGQVDVDATWESYLAELDRLGYNKMMDELEKLPPIEEIVAEYQKAD